MKRSVCHTYNGHRKRLRQRFLRGGIEALQDYEIIEYFLTFSIPVKDVKPRAKELIKRFKNTAGVFNADADALREVTGIGESSIASILFFRELVSRYLKEKLYEDVCLPSTEATILFLKAAFRGKKNEVFKVLFLNNRNCLLAEQTMQEGTVDQAAVYPRDIIARALKTGATRIICAHNHPSGGVTPSQADCRITRDLLAAAYPLGIDLLEHIIIGGSDYFSFAEAGYLKKYYDEHKVTR